MAHALSIGDLAPDFHLATAEGEVVNLYESLRHSSVVLFFYLKSFTPLCMAEACSFRDNVDEFKSLHAKVFGISPDGPTVTKRFAGYHRLSFPLLLDVGGDVRRLFGVPKTLGFLPGRSTYVIGQDRKVLNVVHADFQGARHVSESLRSLRGPQ